MIVLKYKYVFFDMDGTIGDTHEGIFNCSKAAFDKLGIKYEDTYESLRKLIGPPLVYAYKEYFGATEEQAQRAKELYRQRYSVKGIYEMSVYEGMEETLKNLKQSGAYLAVVSAKPQEYIDIIVPYFGLDKYIDFCIGVSMTEKSTSKVHLIKTALEHFNINDMSHVVMIGDRKYDLDSASELGIDGIGVSYGYGDIDELNACNPVFIADNTKQISEYILGD